LSVAGAAPARRLWFKAQDVQAQTTDRGQLTTDGF